WGNEPPCGQWFQDFSVFRVPETPPSKSGFSCWEDFFERPNPLGLVFPMDTPELVYGSNYLFGKASELVCYSGATTPCSTNFDASLYWLGCLPAAKHIPIWSRDYDVWWGPYFAFRRVLPLKTISGVVEA
ncbi:MAG: hypothetical protein KDA84_13820, partial [Planctomycetaceae bacterium]|nr:hypothetical protein [Planctomycetaceae bacterium]